MGRAYFETPFALMAHTIMNDSDAVKLYAASLLYAASQWLTSTSGCG